VRRTAERTLILAIVVVGLFLVSPSLAQAECRICNSYYAWCAANSSYYDRWECTVDPSGARCIVTHHSDKDGCSSDCSENGDCGSGAVLAVDTEHWAWLPVPHKEAPACLTGGARRARDHSRA